MPRSALSIGAWRRYLVVFVLSFPLAFGLRDILQELLRPDLSAAARAYVREHRGAPLSASLAAVLTEPSIVDVPTQTHPLLGKIVPDFTLRDDLGRRVGLSTLCQQGPVVVVFYYGYSCTHCVAQLFAISDDLDHFQELGARVIALSADPSEQTAARFAEYGRFAFPVLCDPDYTVADAYGVHGSAKEERAEFLMHATFIIDPQRRMRWAQYGAEPFLGNETLLREIARCQGWPVADQSPRGHAPTSGSMK